MFNLKKVDIFIIIFCIVFSYKFLFFKLGQSSLTSFDEAWYASITQNMLNSRDFLHLKFNGNYFFDHPPFAFWTMALSMKIFGINAFGARFPSALFALLSITLIYFLGKKMFSYSVGFSSAIALLSANWFLFRARSGNLDIALTFLFILNFYLAYLYSVEKNIKKKQELLYFGVITLFFLFLTKTMIPFTILPVLAVMILPKSNMKLLIKPLSIFLLLIVFFLMSQISVNDSYIKRYLAIGSPGVGETKLSFLAEVKFVKDYLYFGIGKWFWPGILGLIGGVFLFKKKFFYLMLFFVSFMIPFMFSQKVHIWHLIPVFPFMILSAFGFFYDLLLLIFKSKKIASFFVIILCLFISQRQLKRNYREFINIEKYISDEEILSKEAAKYDVDFFIDGDFVPAAAFYSNKKVQQTHVGELSSLFDKNSSFVLITNDWRLEFEKIDSYKYEIIKKDRDKILIWKK